MPAGGSINNAVAAAFVFAEPVAASRRAWFITTICAIAKIVVDHGQGQIFALAMVASEH